jgi:hypothetical protein
VLSTLSCAAAFRPTPQAVARITGAAAAGIGVLLSSPAADAGRSHRENVAEQVVACSFGGGSIG